MAKLKIARAEFKPIIREAWGAVMEDRVIGLITPRLVPEGSTASIE